VFRREVLIDLQVDLLRATLRSAPTSGIEGAAASVLLKLVLRDIR
jgi:hypothetical protein